MEGRHSRRGKGHLGAAWELTASLPADPEIDVDRSRP
jgi:hypothetical protein